MTNDKLPLPKTTEAVTIYATSWCPYCQSLISGLKRVNCNIRIGRMGV